MISIFSSHSNYVTGNSSNYIHSPTKFFSKNLINSKSLSSKHMDKKSLIDAIQWYCRFLKSTHNNVRHFLFHLHRFWIHSAHSKISESTISHLREHGPSHSDSKFRADLKLKLLQRVFLFTQSSHPTLKIEECSHWVILYWLIFASSWYDKRFSMNNYMTR